MTLLMYQGRMSLCTLSLLLLFLLIISPVFSSSFLCSAFLFQIFCLNYILSQPLSLSLYLSLFPYLSVCHPLTNFGNTTSARRTISHCKPLAASFASSCRSRKPPANQRWAVGWAGRSSRDTRGRIRRLDYWKRRGKADSP